MRLDTFVLVAAVGFLATYAHLMFALWAPRFGLPRLDYPLGLSELSFGESYEGHPPYWLGLAVLYLNGIIFALIYANLVGQYLPGTTLVRGLLWGGILFFGSQCFFNPVIARHGFFSRKAHPRAWLTAVVTHVIYGAVLGWLSPIL